MKTIGFDLDGVLYPWQQSAYDWCVRNEYYHDDDWDSFWEIWLPTQSKVFNDNLVRIPMLYHNMLPSQMQVDFLQDLGDRYTIYYVTSRPIEMLSVTENFLKTVRYPQIENLIFAYDKSPIVIQQGIELFVDDRHSIVNDLAKICKTLLYNQSWNLHYQVDPRVIRINTIFEVERYL